MLRADEGVISELDASPMVRFASWLGQIFGRTFDFKKTIESALRFSIIGQEMQLSLQQATQVDKVFLLDFALQHVP